jgi:hypothetical protein
MLKTVTLAEAQKLPRWRRPIVLLFLMAFAMPIAFNTWSTLLNNFVIEVANFDGSDIGLLHTVREIPGFLAVGVIAIIIFVREQVLGLVSLVLLGVATAITAYYPSLTGILTLTMLSSIGFHYYETVNQSLQLQWLPIADAPRILGWMMALGSAATFIVYLIILLLWEPLGLGYNIVYICGGAATAIIAVFAMVAYPQFEGPTVQNKSMVLRKRYWLYYALQFMSGARRQIFVVFAGFMMVEKFGFEVHELTSLFLINLMINMLVAPLLGRIVQRFGERRTLVFEYVGLALVFLSYGGVYYLGWGVLVAAFLYVVDIAPTAAVAFTINHIAAVVLPVTLGLLWLVSPLLVFLIAAGMACVSLSLALLIPRHPGPGHETIFKPALTEAAA